MLITVLLGGDSAEREVSRVSGCEVARALRNLGHQVTAVDTLTGPLEEEEEEEIVAAGVRRPGPLPPPHFSDGFSDLILLPQVMGADLLFLALHGGTGEDGTIQTFLEVAGLPFTGSDRVACTLAMEKEVSKRLLRDAGIATPDWLVGPQEPSIVAERLGLPVIVKPGSGGSTVGLSLAASEEEIAEATVVAAELGAGILYERYVKGRELTVGVIGEETLPVGEIIPDHILFDYECKYTPGKAKEIFPADLPEEVSDRLRARALAVHRTLRLGHLSRVDFILDEAGESWCLEANTLPGMTAGSLLPQAAAAAGIPFPELCERIVEVALLRPLAHRRESDSV